MRTFLGSIVPMPRKQHVTTATFRIPRFFENTPSKPEMDSVTPRFLHSEPNHSRFTFPMLRNLPLWKIVFVAMNGKSAKFPPVKSRSKVRRVIFAAGIAIAMFLTVGFIRFPPRRIPTAHPCRRLFRSINSVFPHSFVFVTPTKAEMTKHSFSHQLP